MIIKKGDAWQATGAPHDHGLLAWKMRINTANDDNNNNNSNNNLFLIRRKLTSEYDIDQMRLTTKHTRNN